MYQIPDDPSVLIVEQEPASLILLDALFRNNGFRTLLARSAAEAAEIVARPYVPVDAVLTGIEIMRDRGAELMNPLWRDRPDVPVVFLSAILEAGAIRIKLMRQIGLKYFADAEGAGVIEAVRAAISVARLHACT
ncbi:MAG: response regulator [Acidobacteriota bacterium]